jgi:hypothetical protein
MSDTLQVLLAHHLKGTHRVLSNGRQIIGRVFGCFAPPRTPTI